MFNSGKTRRHIGILKKRLLQQRNNIKDILQEYGIQEKNPVFSSLNNDEIYDFKNELLEAHQQLLRSYTKIQELHMEWSAVRITDKKEEETYNEYINTYGDYSSTVQQAVDTLDNNDELFNAIDVELSQRHLPVEARKDDLSTVNPRHDADASVQHSTIPPNKAAKTSQVSIQPMDTMNFVDASILSRLDLPTFDGNLLEFPEFFARFSALIGSKKQLDDTTKFSLLKSCLKGRALQSIHGLALTANNYAIALDILKSRYDDKVTIRHILFSQLANLPPCDPEGRHLQSLYNKMYSLTRQFCVYEDDSKEVALGAILLNKLPRHIRSKIYDKTGNAHNLTPSELLQVLTSIVHKEATLQEIDYHCKQTSRSYEEGYFGLHKSHNRLSSSTQFRRSPTHHGGYSSSNFKVRQCSFCKSTQHNSLTCTKFDTPQLRIQVIKDKKLCFNCLSSRHRTKECPSKSLCQVCSKRHHTSICLRRANIQEFQKRHQTMSATKMQSPLRTTATKGQTEKGQVYFANNSISDAITHQVHFAQNSTPGASALSDDDSRKQNELVASIQDDQQATSKTVLMMCVEVQVFNPDNPSKSTKTIAFLDSGSSKSYITSELAKSLELPEGERREISMYTFGSLSPLPLPTTMHTIGIYTNQRMRYLSVKALETLTNELRIATVNEATCEVQALTTISKKPSLLIGSDYFWDVLLFEEFYVKTLSNGYRLGDIVTGQPLQPNVDYCYNSFAVSNKNLDKLVNRFWELESEGIFDAPKHSDDDECMRKFSETTYFDKKEGRYIVQLPFKGKQEDLPDNIQLAYARLKQNVKSLRLRPAQSILRNTYVDNIFYGVDNIEEGKQFYQQSKELFQQAGMNLRQYVSNSTELNQFLSEQENSDVSTNIKILGISWNISEDSLCIKLPTVFTDNIWTKRKILKAIASTYDPLGWCSPVLFSSKVFLQSLWKENLGWDESLPAELTNKWKALTSKWITMKFVAPRRIISGTRALFEVHVFTDASILGYCATAYLVEISNVHKSTLLMSKTRLSPLKAPLTIPRLELSAIAMGSHLLKHICANLDLPISKTVIWSDSSVALSWIKNEKELPVFIRNRVRTIKENAPNSDLRYVPGNDNPADIGSRGTTPQELMSLKLWWEGPTFLLQPTDKWPTDITSDPTMEAYHAEEDQTSSTATEDFINTKRFSTWIKLHRTVYYVLLFLTKTSTRAKQHFGNNRSALFNKAETILFRLAQKQNPPSEEVKTQLQLYHCNNSALWKSRGRITNADMPAQTITPVFLPRENYVTSLYILHSHQGNNHSGINQTLCELRRNVWIPKGRMTVKKALHNLCYYCRRYKAQPFSLPEFPAHPPRRVRKPNFPFENIGMDYAGPLFYKNDDNSTSKYWILLITCLNTRAIYVDLLKDMTAKTLLHALRRFFASTAYPKWILCDNAKTFKSIDELQSSYKFEDDNDPDIIDYCAQRRIEFKFIPSLSPWQGGLYEKMVHIFKVSFKHSLQNRLLKFEELQTIAKETETIVNQRPLTYMTEDDEIIPLRPIDFLRPWTNLSSPRTEEYTDEWKPTTQTRDQLMEEWRTINDLLTRFWRRWSSEYLTNLREQHRVTHPHPRCINESQPKAGDIVLIQEKSLERGQWKIGRLVSSTDNFQRSATVSLPSRRTITRPINMLCKLELGDMPEKKENAQQNEETAQPSHPQNEHPMLTRSKTSKGNIKHFLALALAFSTFNALLADTRCPAEINTPKTIVYATNCVSKGIAIAKLDEKKKLCWFPLSCPIGSIRIPLPFRQNQGMCGPECRCPPWATSCSFSSSPRQKNSKISNVPFTIASYRPEHVCSFSPSENCDKRRKIDKFNQVQLYDDTLLVVEQLHIIIKDYIDANDFLCFDVNGTQQAAITPYTGTSYFCNKNNCDDNAELFCTFGTPSAILATPEGEESLLVKAWGVTTKEYYGHLSPETSHPSISTICTKGGIHISVTSPTTAIEACINNYCQFISNPSDSNIVFPITLVAFNYKVEVSAWKDGKLIYQQGIECQASPVCELIECSLCLELIYNPNCWSRTQIVMTASFLFAAILTLCILHPILRLLSILTRISTLVFRRTIQKVFWKVIRKPKDFAVYTGNRRNLLLAIIFAITITPTQHCSEVISVTASEETCIQNKNNNTCTFNQASVVTLQPLNQEMCLLLKNNNNSYAGMITIRVKGLYFTCKRKVEFFTRDHHFYSESVHRCRFAGSCNTGTCDKIKPTDKLPELSNTANKHPGYTFCAASCGCLTCSGCFFCLTSCLFYRYYAYPESPTVYTVFNCPLWEFTVDVHITIQKNGHSEGAHLVLHPAKTTRWNNIRLSLIAAMIPQMPILSSTFVTDGNAIAITKPATSGQLIPNTIGQLQCLTYEDAKHFKCSFPSNACVCSAATNQAVCTCSHGSISEVFKKTPLPQLTKNVMIYQKDNEVIAKTKVGTAIQLHLVTEDLKMVSTRLNTTCSIVTSELSGCYDCLAGAQISIACKSDKGDVTAEVHCGNQLQIAICTPTGHINRLILNFNSSKIRESCTLSCPGGTMSFEVTGELSYFNDGVLHQQQGVANRFSDISLALPSFNRVFELLRKTLNNIASPIFLLKTSFILMIFIPISTLLLRLVDACQRARTHKKLI
ncbi:zinc knuckle [Ancylostoma caninum]|uniref:Zinc knuckle n=1 Tax=Ancylostoma caninum TaxID=29170 RepID=A0A368FV72_ANCCA|nr:zinc knuckle [Ancylostoma caninum]